MDKTEDLAPLADKKVGDKCVLKNVELTITATDDKGLTGTITELELGDEYPEPESPAEDSSEPSEKGESKGMAMKAMMGKSGE